MKKLITLFLLLLLIGCSQTDTGGDGVTPTLVPTEEPTQTAEPIATEAAEEESQTFELPSGDEILAAAIAAHSEPIQYRLNQVWSRENVRVQIFQWFSNCIVDQQGQQAVCSHTSGITLEDSEGQTDSQNWSAYASPDGFWRGEGDAWVFGDAESVSFAAASQGVPEIVSLLELIEGSRITGELILPSGTVTQVAGSIDVRESMTIIGGDPLVADILSNGEIVGNTITISVDQETNLLAQLTVNIRVQLDSELFEGVLDQTYQDYGVEFIRPQVDG